MAADGPTNDYRASDADREAAAQRLRHASVEGRIDSDELEERLAAAYAARTVADLERLVADVSPPPPPPPAPPPYGMVPVPYGAPYPPGVFAPQPAPTNGLAVASLVSGVLWLGWFGSVCAVIFGHVALSQIKQNGPQDQGRGLAIGGLVLGYFGLGTLLLIVIAALA
jgi:hypothetical protein